MTFHTHVDSFAGLPIFEFGGDNLPADKGSVAWRLSAEFEETEQFAGKYTALLAADWVGEIRALVFGDWGDSYDSSVDLAPLIAAADRFTSLRALFIGEIVGEESEVSWINLPDLDDLLHAYPGLEVLRVRGNSIQFPVGHYPNLRELALEAGGLPVSAVRAVGESDLPALGHLELWLGTDAYGGDANVEDLTPILSGANTPALTYLGLRNAEIIDLLAAAVAAAPVVARVRTLDLSMGMLSDVGAAALLSGQPLTHLAKLDLHHHFLTKEMTDRIRDELEAAGVEVDLSEDHLNVRNPEDRYIAVSE